MSVRSKGQMGGQILGQNYKNQFQPTLLKIWYVSLVGDFKSLKTLTFDLGGHWRSNYKNWFSSYSTKPLEILYLRAFSATWP